jgi:hypothetical protein
VNKGGHDLSAALKYGGPLIFMTDGQQSRFAVASMYRKFAEVLNESEKDDYILLTGLTNMSCIACTVFGYIHGQLNMLLFKDGRYIERKLMLGELLQRREYGISSS